VPVDTAKKPFHLVANDVKVTNDGRRATFAFDSPAKYEAHIAKVNATVTYTRGARDWERARTTAKWINEVTLVPALEPAKDEPKKLRFALKTGARTITAKDGAGTIRISLKRKKADDTFPMFFSVDGADVVSVGGTLEPSGAEWKSATDGSGTVTLANLIPGNVVTIHAFSLKGTDVVDEQDVTLSVQPQPIVVAVAKEE